MKDHVAKVGDLVRFRNGALGIILKKHTKAGKTPYYLVYVIEENDTEWAHSGHFEKHASTSDDYNYYAGLVRSIALA